MKKVFMILCLDLVCVFMFQTQVGLMANNVNSPVSVELSTSQTFSKVQSRPSYDGETFYLIDSFFGLNQEKTKNLLLKLGILSIILMIVSFDLNKRKKRLLIFIFAMLSFFSIINAAAVIAVTSFIFEMNFWASFALMGAVCASIFASIAAFTNMLTDRKCYLFFIEAYCISMVLYLVGLFGGM